MKKFILFIVLIIIFVFSFSCGEKPEINPGTTENGQSEKETETTYSEATAMKGESPEKLSVSVDIQADGNNIIPYKEFMCSYVNGVNADGYAMLSTDYRINLVKMPVVTLKKDLIIKTGNTYLDEISIQNAETGEKIGKYPTDALSGLLPDGTYIASFVTTAHGTEDRKNEYVSYIYYVCIVIGEESNQG